MADNPFLDQLNSINGITVDQDHLGGFVGSDLGVGSDVDTVEVNSANSVSIQPGQMIVTNFDYTAPTVYYGVNVLPTFGTVEFSGDPGVQYKIIGFTENGILLSTSSLPSVFDGASSISAGGATFLSLGQSVDQIGFPLTFETDPAVFCFAEGTRIETLSGSVAVEDLAKGDVVLTASGAARPIRWIGQLISRPARHPRPWEVNPVRVHAHAFGEDRPARDVRLSPGHAVYVDGVLVPVGQLVNGATIVQEEVETIRYFHVELDSHDVLLAEGLPCESYLDDGNRPSFANAGEFAELHGRLDPKSWDDACAPLVADGPQLVEIQRRLLVQAEALGWVRSERPDLVIVADGVEIAPESMAGDVYRFNVPAAAELTLRSNSGRLAEVMPGLADRRPLGVAISALAMDGRPVDLQSDVFGPGFYPVEHHGANGWRWTDGAAALRLAPAAPVVIDVRLLMVAPTWNRCMPELRLVA